MDFTHLRFSIWKHDIDTIATSMDCTAVSCYWCVKHSIAVLGSSINSEVVSFPIYCSFLSFLGPISCKCMFQISNAYGNLFYQPAHRFICPHTLIIICTIVHIRITLEGAGTLGPIICTKVTTFVNLCMLFFVA